jgi:hypothetical protein
VSAGRSAYSSAVEPGRGRSSLGPNSNSYYTVGYADDIAILIDGNFPHTVSEVVQIALHTVQKRRERTKLSINPNKTVIIPFTRRRYNKGLK